MCVLLEFMAGMGMIVRPVIRGVLMLMARACIMVMVVFVFVQVVMVMNVDVLVCVNLISMSVLV